MDPASGKQVLQMDDSRLQLLLQREKDKMKSETGYSNEQITKFLQANSEQVLEAQKARMAEARRQFEEERAQIMKLKAEQQAQKATKNEEDDQWEDESDEGA